MVSVSFNKTISLVLMLVFAVSTAQLGWMLREAPKPSKSLQTVTCPFHSTQCCCPELCNRSRVSTAKRECHTPATRSVVSFVTPSPGLRPPSPKGREAGGEGAGACMLRSGCNSPDLLTGSGSVLKDFLPESLERLSLQMPVSCFAFSLQSPTHGGYRSVLLQPPRCFQT
jgi:hypothetical protein